MQSLMNVNVIIILTQDSPNNNDVPSNSWQAAKVAVIGRCRVEKMTRTLLLNVFDANTKLLGAHVNPIFDSGLD